ncbi:MAG: type I 3-dehydroquinate dehydratase [Vulcanisaeta sp.]|jgi:3-dehydroquinate dehydratase-1|nr:type I 3-dehydroquinate dehydratase [Vulcanisaeta sp.]MCG2892289.1 type I 3-dehydroquinate dehydratase [Vulcanisaeta sp.]MCG2894647.1 type I 3-dehydroquinate dehydratase [Vulcanisaeta sp.]
MNAWSGLLLNKPVLICAIPVRRLRFQYLPASCEAVELRLDYLDDLRPSPELRGFIEDYASHYPTIVTVREYNEGGNRVIDPSIKYEVLELGRGVGALVDVEASLLAKSPETYGKLVEGSIVSRHVFSKEVNSYELALRDLELARRYGALIYKIFTVRDDDFVNLLSLVGKAGIHVAVIPSNPVYRAVSMMMGSSLMYCSVRQRTGPGQLNIGVCSKIKMFKRSLAMYGPE